MINYRSRQMTTQPDHSSKALDEQNKHVVNKQEYVLISEMYIPRIFRFKSKVLPKLKLSEAEEPSEYVRKLFDFLINKLVLNKYSKNKACKNSELRNRMKTEEKIKFLMRSFQIKYADRYDKQYKINTAKFNKEAQKAFFDRPEVQEYFLSFLPEIMNEKNDYNECRMLEAEHILSQQILLSKGKHGYEISSSVKRMQLPWTDNMFDDIRRFGLNWYNSFVDSNDKIEDNLTDEEK